MDLKDIVKTGLSCYRKSGMKYFLKYCYKKITKYEQRKYRIYLKSRQLTQDERQAQSNQRFKYEPKISIVVPLYKTPEKYLRDMIESVQQQTYTNWELCLSDGSGNDSPIQSILQEYQKSDGRIKVAYSGKKCQISDNTNEALELVTGDFIGFADHDDILACNALYECVRVLNQYPETLIIYTDEDKVSMDGRKHFQPHFKPDYNKDLLNSTNYFCHFFLVSREVLGKVGCLNSEFDGAQDYDFVLRCCEVTEEIYHIPMILYHWRAHMNSTAENPESKKYAYEAGRKALEAHYKRMGIDNAKVVLSECLGIYRTYYLIEQEPLVSIIIPNKDHVVDLKKCLESIKKTNYKNYEVIIVENNSVENETFNFYSELERLDNFKVVYWKGSFNYSAINNYGVKHAKGQYFLFLNNDTEIINRDCIHELLGVCMRPDVGVVGARLFFGDDTIQHAGVVIGLGGCAGHVFLNTPKEQVGYFARVITQQDYSAVTGACMLVKKNVFDEVGGFDPALEVAFNDIDLCLKIRTKGYLVVYNPYAELYHYESKSRGSDQTFENRKRFDQETKLFRSRWHKILENGDPYYNCNLSVVNFDCSLK